MVDAGAIELVASFEGRMLVSVGVAGSGAQLWEVDAGGSWTSLPLPPTPVSDYCVTEDQRVVGIRHPGPGNGAITHDMDAAQVSTEAAFVVLEGDRWAKQEFDTQATDALEHRILVCAGDEALSLGNEVAIQQGSSRVVDVLPDGVLPYLVTEVPSDQTTIVARFVQGADFHRVELASLGGEAIEFRELPIPREGFNLEAVAVGPDDELLVALANLSDGSLTWNLIASPLPG
jgi:hypothetical protein